MDVTVQSGDEAASVCAGCYIYTNTGVGPYGGVGGGPIEGAVNATVIGFDDFLPVECSTVVLGTDPEGELQERTDANGMVTLSTPDLAGEQVVTAAGPCLPCGPCYGTTTATADAQNAVLLLPGLPAPCGQYAPMSMMALMYNASCQACTSDDQCLEGSSCVGGRCDPPCTSDAECGPFNYCIGGMCLVSCPEDLQHYARQIEPDPAAPECSFPPRDEITDEPCAEGEEGCREYCGYACPLSNEGYCPAGPIPQDGGPGPGAETPRVTGILRWDPKTKTNCDRERIAVRSGEFYCFRVATTAGDRNEERVPAGPGALLTLTNSQLFEKEVGAYEIQTRAGDMGIYAVSGYCSNDRATGDTVMHEPCAFGITHNVFVEPCPPSEATPETLCEYGAIPNCAPLEGKDLMVDIELTANLDVEMVDPPHCSGTGPDTNVLEPFVYLGGEGWIAPTRETQQMGDDVVPDPIWGPATRWIGVSMSDSSFEFPRFFPVDHERLSNGGTPSYTFDAVAFNPDEIYGTQMPISFHTMNDVVDYSGRILIDPMLGGPYATVPPTANPPQRMTGDYLEWDYCPGAPATVHLVVVYQPQFFAPPLLVALAVVPGDQQRVNIVDAARLVEADGLDGLPSGFLYGFVQDTWNPDLDPNRWGYDQVFDPGNVWAVGLFAFIR